LLAGCNNVVEFTCDPLKEPPPIDWEGIDERAHIVFQVSCTDRTEDELTTKYQTDATEAMVRTLPIGARYLLLIDRSGRAEVFCLGLRSVTSKRS
jgi:hypothetical protein